jgi:hypothetical protein
MGRYANEGGLGGLADRSPRPASCPHQKPAVVEAAIVGLRREHPGCPPGYRNPRVRFAVLADPAGASFTASQFVAENR